ncbi:MAG: hypothetical protein M3Q71_15600 [Chloroflexota bacterium]|nr:hypothetical protein [Chloroflexota bacterium]
MLPEGPGRTYLGSADLMERNLDRRVEAVFPVEDGSLAAHLRDLILPAYLRDTVNARQLQSDGTWTRPTCAGRGAVRCPPTRDNSTLRPARFALLGPQCARIRCVRRYVFGA